MDIEMGRPNANPTYFEEVVEFGMFLDNTAKLAQKIKEANEEFNSATRSSEMKEIKGRMEKDIDEVGKMAHILKERLRKMIRKNIENRKNPGCEKGTAIDISRITLTIALKPRIKQRKSDFQNLAETIRQEYLNVIERRIFTVTGIKLSDEVIRVIDTGSVVQMFENAVQGISAKKMVAVVDEIQERHATATDFDKKILEVQKNFEQMAALVEAGQKFDKALEEVQKLAGSTEMELCDEQDKNYLLLAIVIMLAQVLLFVCASLVL